MLPDPVNIAAQVFAMAIPKFATKAYIIARAVELCELEAIVLQRPCKRNRVSGVIIVRNSVQLAIDHANHNHTLPNSDASSDCGYGIRLCRAPGSDHRYEGC